MDVLGFHLRLKIQNIAWSSSGTDNTNHYVTSSFNPQYISGGGGAWYLSGSDGTNYEVSQSFDTRSEKRFKR